MELSQRATQSQNLSQIQKMSQQQILSMKVLSLATDELENEIYDFAEKNPALEISKDAYSPEFRKKKSKAADFDTLIDRTADNRTSLYDHLEFQLNSMNLSQPEHDLGIKLIENLDSAGHHILSPYSFVDSSDYELGENLLKKMLSIIQNLDPIGTCVKDVSESLLVQALGAAEKNDLALFILDGHFDFLDPPRPEKILRKLKDFSASEKNLKSYDDSFHSGHDFENLSVSDVEETLDFIKGLDPNPARNFGDGSPNYVRVDAEVKVLDGKIVVSFPEEELPGMEISSEYERVCESRADSESEKANSRFAKQSIFEAKSFIEALDYRKSSVKKAALEIAERQWEFFLKGPAFLKPFLQKELASVLKVHETTVSRIANKKYLSCNFGVFPFGYFFTNQVGGKKVGEGEGAQKNLSQNEALSKESVKFQIASILSEHKDNKKPLSDQKVADILSERGIKVARRTVAKYRAELNLGSSYER
jgi:RNA polymerase sigma-54 factor